MSDQVLAQSVRIANEVAQGSRCVCSSLLLGVLQQLNKKHYAWSQVLIENIVVEPSIADCKAGKLSSIPIAILATIYRSLDEPMLQKLLIEELSVAAEVSDKVANFSSDPSVLMLDKHVEVVIKVRVVDRLVKVFGDASQLGH